MWIANEHDHLETEWNDKNINTSSNDSIQAFYGFKYVFSVSPKKIGESLIDKKFRDRFMYPSKRLGEHATCGYAYKGIDKFYYVATNCYEDAIIIALEYK